MLPCQMADTPDFTRDRLPEFGRSRAHGKQNQIPRTFSSLNIDRIPARAADYGVIFDVIYLVTSVPIMAAVVYWMITAGIIGGLRAAPFGAMDWIAIP